MQVVSLVSSVYLNVCMCVCACVTTTPTADVYTYDFLQVCVCVSVRERETTKGFSTSLCVSTSSGRKVTSPLKATCI
jgi:hypothetical protein